MSLIPTSSGGESASAWPSTRRKRLASCPLLPFPHSVLRRRTSLAQVRDTGPWNEAGLSTLSFAVPSPGLLLLKESLLLPASSARHSGADRSGAPHTALLHEKPAGTVAGKVGSSVKKKVHFGVRWRHLLSCWGWGWGWLSTNC